MLNYCTNLKVVSYSRSKLMDKLSYIVHLLKQWKDKLKTVLSSHNDRIVNHDKCTSTFNNSEPSRSKYKCQQFVVYVFLPPRFHCFETLCFPEADPASVSFPDEKTDGAVE